MGNETMKSSSTNMEHYYLVYNVWTDNGVQYSCWKAVRTSKSYKQMCKMFRGVERISQGAFVLLCESQGSKLPWWEVSSLPLGEKKEII